MVTRCKLSDLLALRRVQSRLVKLRLLRLTCSFEFFNCLVAAPALWQQRTNLWRRVTNPARAAKRLKKRGTGIGRAAAPPGQHAQGSSSTHFPCHLRRESNVNEDQAPLSEYDRAMLRATLAFPGTAPAVFTNKNGRGLLGADETCMTCPRCGSAAQGHNDGGKPCQDFKCDACCYVFAKST